MATREFFLGGNTTEGFYSYFDHLIPRKSAKRIVCIKGGPGTGKSSFMRKIATSMSLRGFEVESMHCSADPGSLDGVSIPRLGLAFVDGTAPHVIDPIYPGAVDEILNLGDFWDRKDIENNKEQIMQCQEQISNHYRFGYNYLSAAKAFYKNVYSTYKQCTNPVGVDIELEAIMSEFSEIPYAQAPAHKRKLFASAITSEGLVNYLDTLISQRKVYRIEGSWGTGTELLLARIAAAAVMHGFYTEAYYCPIAPSERIEHVIIPALSLAFTTSNKYHSSPAGSVTIDMDAYTNEKAFSEYSDTIEYNTAMFDATVHKAVTAFEDARALHDRLETYYIPYMDFDRINSTCENILKQL